MNALADDLWPIDLVEDLPVTPLNILKAQAVKIGERTKNIIEGRVDTSSANRDDMVLSFKLIAPVLNNYSYELFRLIHPVQLYPITVAGAGTMLRSEEELIEWLRQKLSEPKTGQIVRSLFAQSS